jgi:carbon-monoxide dehydrogenase large subunit
MPHFDGMGSAIIPTVSSDSASERLIGRRLLRQEDPRLVTGKGAYVTDLALPGMLHTAVLRSPHAHARIARVNVERARLVPGVVAVLTAADLRDVGPLPVMAHPPGQRQTDFPVLPADRARYVGQPLAAVVAETRYAAQDGVEAFDVTYDPLPAVTDVAQATAPGAPKLYDEWPDNVVVAREIGSGDPDAVFATAPVVVEARFTMPRQTAAPMEGRAICARFDGDTGELTVWVSSQAPHLFRTVLAGVLRLDEEKIRVIVPDVGGGFGVKLHYYPEDVLVAVAAMRLGRPVKWVETRAEHFAATVHAREQRVHARAAFDTQGMLLALRAHVQGDVGAHLHTKGAGPIFLGGVVLPNVYAVRHFKAKLEAVVTNKVPFGAYRAFGMQQAAFVTERLMDMAAVRLGIGPAEIRRRNYVPPSAFPYRSAANLVYDSGDYPKALDEALRIADYGGLRKMQARAQAEGRLVGIGVANYVEVTGMGPTKLMAAMGNRQGGYESATVRLEPSGRVTVATGIIEVGQGIRSALAQVAADVLSVSYDRVGVVLGDTARTPYSCYGTADSRGSVTGGAAVLKATRTLMEKLMRVAAHHLEVAEADLEVVDGQCRVRGAPGRSVSFAALAQESLRGQKLPDGIEPELEARFTYNPENWTFPYGVHIAAVEVARETGIVHVLGYWVAHDCGTMLNPMLVEGQLQGGLAQGIGAALSEELCYDEAGQLLSRTFMDYAIPTADTMPPIAIGHVETPSPHTPGGMKGMAEGGTIGAPATIANAVADALVGAGVDAGAVAAYPLTASKVFALLQSATRLR